MITTNLGKFERQIKDGQDGAEHRITGVFAKVDSLIVQVRQENRDELGSFWTKTVTKIEKIEMKLQMMSGGGGPPLSSEPRSRAGR